MSRERSSLDESERLTQNDPSSLSNPLPIFSVIRDAKTAGSRIGNGRVKRVHAELRLVKETTRAQEDLVAVKERITVEEDKGKERARSPGTVVQHRTDS